MKINIESWKLFEYRHVFDIQKGFYNKKPESSKTGQIPFLGAIDNNNGITEYYTNEEIESSSKTGKGKNHPLDKKIFPGQSVCITNNGSVGYAYYQENPFTCSHDVNPLYRLDGSFNIHTGLFIASVIMKDRYRWGYGRKWRPERMEKSKILLPQTAEGNPDWVYMENFIKEQNCKPITTKILNDQNIQFDLNNWKEFKLHKIFDIRMGNGIDVVKTSTFEPKFNYVSRNSNGNGVVAIVDEIKGETPCLAGTMTVALGGSYLGSCFLQNEPYYTAQNVAILKEKIPLSIFSKLFISTLIRNECKTKYLAFGRELNSHINRDFAIKLPVKYNDNGFLLDDDNSFSDNGYIPDWEYIENFFNSLPFSDRI